MKTQADTGLGSVPSGNSFVFLKEGEGHFNRACKWISRKKKEANRLGLCFLLTGSACRTHTYVQAQDQTVASTLPM